MTKQPRLRRLVWPLALLLLASLACSVLSPRPAATVVPPSATLPAAATATALPTEAPAVAATDTVAPTDTAAPTDTVAPTGTVAPSATNRPNPTVTPVPAATAAPATLAAVSPTTSALSFLAYVKDGELLVTDVTGGAVGGTTQYTQSGVNDGVFDLVWSPDGQYIAFASAPPSGDSHVYVVYAVGAGTPVDLGPGAAPNWSPDSKQIVFVRDGNIYLTPLDHPQPKALTAKTNWSWGRPTFTPAGDALVVSGQSFDNEGAQGNTTFSLDTLPLDGSGTLTPLPGFSQPVDGRLPYDLRFSPDGKKLAFSTSWHVSACASSGQYYVANADGSSLTQLGSQQLRALLQPNMEFYYIVFGYAWQPQSDGLLITSLVVDCTNFDGTHLGQTMSTVDLAGRETVLSVGFFGSPSYDRTGSLLAVAQPADNGAPGQVALYDAGGHPVVQVGPGSLPAFQP